MMNSPGNDERAGAARLLAEEVTVVNVGLQGFFDDLRRNNVAAIHVDWAPPAGGDPRMAALLAKLGV